MSSIPPTPHTAVQPWTVVVTAVEVEGRCSFPVPNAPAQARPSLALLTQPASATALAPIASGRKGEYVLGLNERSRPSNGSGENGA